ncbi:prolyl oligopeptidase family serine peptidase [Mitsuaria sp. GD03876]|uniref:prolyl oligopeptidase family serine peptidase n=1 Tax=Mitsuaria sp. GD03876 TaxID=2975399 RepID=UPI00244B3ABF|nr:prolyl oligopeptidase family serine peptidase [Mitsuaria sp. GD03876]MDH0866509.1 prolyl oligopeptidase family serine peptidase [Mitsuaria sp. GD03876]
MTSDLTPTLRAQPIQRTIGGVTFEDRFEYLREDRPDVLDWQWARDRLAQRATQSSPNYAALRERYLGIGHAEGYGVPCKRGAHWFALVNDGDDQVLRVSDAPGGPGRAIVSRRALVESVGGGTAMLVFLDPSPQGRFVALAWGANGDMLGKWSVYETATGRHLQDLPAIMYSGARAGWLPDESGFWLDGRGADGLHQLRFVPVADGAAERPVVPLPEDLVAAKHSGLTLQVSPDGRRGLLVTTPHEHVALVHLDLETLEATPFLPDGVEGECDGGWIDQDHYAARVSHGAARGRVVAIPAATSRDTATWRELVPESEGFLGWAGVVAGRLYVGDLVDVSLRVRVFDLKGTLLETLPLENPGSSLSMSGARAIAPNDVFVLTHGTFTRSSVTLLHDPDTGALRQLDAPKCRLDGVVAEQRFATSRDGTRIPYFVVRRQDLPTDRPQPTLVHAYGGFNMSLLPNYPAMFAPFVEAGGVYVQASLRGGGEYGKAWHDGGRLAHKQHTFDDLRAVAEALIADGVATRDTLCFQGGSNGGLLAGAAMVQQPELWHAIVALVPIFDMMEPLPPTPAVAGVKAIFLEDYGDPDRPADAANILRWSPYHNVADSVAYPALYQVFGEQDVGCMPFHGRKFTARLDEADTGGRPIHLRVWRDTGHSASDPVQAAAYHAEWMSFLMDQLGMTAAGAGTR